MTNALLTNLAGDEHAWGQTEGMAVAILLAVAFVLTLILGGVFLYILTRKEDDPPRD